MKYNGSYMHETLGEVEKFLIVNLTIVNTEFNSTVMQVEGNYWQNMEESLGSSLREILGLDDGILTEIKLLDKYFISNGNHLFLTNIT